MEEKRTETGWAGLEKALASEIISGKERVSKAKNFAIACLSLAIVAVSIGMALINFNNDREWRELFASYDYVSQDGEGYNYYNADIEGDVNNGAENPTIEE